MLVKHFPSACSLCFQPGAGLSQLCAAPQPLLCPWGRTRVLWAGTGMEGCGSRGWIFGGWSRAWEHQRGGKRHRGCSLGHQSLGPALPDCSLPIPALNSPLIHPPELFPCPLQGSSPAPVPLCPSVSLLVPCRLWGTWGQLRAVNVAVQVPSVPRGILWECWTLGQENCTFPGELQC